MILTFVIPFKPSSQSPNWELDNLLLERTINTLLLSISQSIRIIIVSSDNLKINTHDNRVSVIIYPFEKFAINEIENYTSILRGNYNNPRHLEQHLDKSLKIMWGCKVAKERGSTFIMSVDSDDLISRKLVPYILKQSENEFGWYIPKGFLFKEATNYLIRVPRSMHFLNGSTHILNSNLIEFPGENCKSWNKINLFTDHGYLKYRLKVEKNIELKPVPFYSIIYSRNNITNISKEHFKSPTKLKSVIKKMINFRPITDTLRQEYNLEYQKKLILKLTLTN